MPLFLRRYRLTSTGTAVLIGCALLYLASLTSLSSLLLFLIGIFAGCFLLNWLGATYSLHHLQWHLPARLLADESGSSLGTVRVTNTGRYPVGLLELSHPRGTLARVAHLPAHESLSIPLQFKTLSRGIYSLSQVELSSSYPFGLLRIRKPLPLPGRIVVAPAIYATEPPPVAGAECVMGGGLKGHGHSSSGLQFAGIRPLVPGDSLRQVHWKSSAKGLGLMVKQFDQELSGRVVVLTATSAARESLDNCLRTAGSLIFAALDAGHHVRWLQLHNALIRDWSPFERGDEILEELAAVEPEPFQWTATALKQAELEIPRRAAVSVVCCDPSKATAGLIHAWQSDIRRPVSVYRPRPRALVPEALFSPPPASHAPCPQPETAPA